MKHLRALLPGMSLYLLFVGGYGVLFLGSPLPSLNGLAGRAEWTRAELWAAVFQPGELLAKWFGMPGEFALADRLPVLLVAAAILGCAGAAGWLLMRLARADRGLTRLEGVVFSTAVGLNAISTYVLAVGLAGWLHHRSVFVMPATLVLGVAGWLGWRAFRTDGRTADGIAGSSSTAGKARRDARGPRTAVAGHTAGRKPKPGGPRTSLAPAETASGELLSLRWLWLAAPMVLMILLGGMLPPLDFDVREYHLQVPKEYFQQGQIGMLPYNVYGNMPLGAEMHCLLAMVVTGNWWLGALAGKTVIASMTVLTALGLLAAGSRFFSRSAGVVAAVVYLSIPWIASVSTAGLVEGVSAFYLLLSVYAVLLATGQNGAESAGQGVRRLLLAGYLAGGAVATKYPAVLFVLLPLAVWVFLAAWIRRKDAGSGERGGLFRWQPGRRVLVLLLAATLGCGLWFGKNWALAGNPTYPLLFGIFGGETRTVEKDRQWTTAHSPKDFSIESLRADLALVAWRSEWLSPLAVPLAVLAVLERRRRWLTAGLLAYFGFVIAAWWLLTHRIDRFWIPALPLLALLAGAGACWCRQAWWRRVLAGVLVVGLAVNFLVADAIGYGRYCVRLDRLRRDPARVNAWHQYFNSHVHFGRVLMVGEAQVFDIEPPVLYNTCFDDSLFEQIVRDPTSGKARPAEAVRAALVAGDVTYVFVSWGELKRYRDTYGFAGHADPDTFLRFVAEQTERLVREGVLEPLPMIEGNEGRGYRVIAPDGPAETALHSVLSPGRLFCHHRSEGAPAGDWACRLAGDEISYPARCVGLLRQG